MKKLLLPIMLVLSCAMGWTGSLLYRDNTHSNRTIDGIYPDERGYITVTFTENGRQYGYDYLTPEEFRHFINNEPF